MKQAPLIQTKSLHLTVNLFAPEAPLAQATQLGGAFAALLSEAKPVPTDLTPPAIGEYWPGQGGIYGGLRLYPEGLCHVIFSETDVGKHAFGDHGNEVEGTNQVDGRTNTTLLIAREGKHPAAIAAAGYTAGGHSDFYLPAAGELSHGYQYLPQVFEKEWYVSSSQRSAYGAFIMYFDGGYQDIIVKNGELRVRPVRRFLQ